MRETRSYGSARGVRSNPYPYRDNLPPGAGGTVKTHPLKPASESATPPSLPPHHHTSARDSPRFRAEDRRHNRQRKARSIGSPLGHGSRHNRDRNAPPIESGSRHESAAHPSAIGNASAAQTARTTPHIDTTKPAAKEKSFLPASVRPKPDCLPRLTRPQRTLYAVP